MVHPSSVYGTGGWDRTAGLAYPREPRASHGLGRLAERSPNAGDRRRFDVSLPHLDAVANRASSAHARSVAEGDRTTLVVAVAGITATALVGLAGTAGAWLSARSDRAAQHELSRDERAAQQELARAERRYDRRVAAYLDAIDFVEGQKTSVLETVSHAGYWVRGRPIPALPATSLGKLRSIPYTQEVPSRLVSRLRAFGSKEVLAAFQKTQEQSYNLPICVIRGAIYMRCTFADAKGVPLVNAYEKFAADIVRFEELVRGEVG